ncbi:MAG: type VI secretion system tip protein VgrG [Methylicorpusculum sp.]|uniref:type VI secretion system Vgr family protein n=1 Tax=Methylicorpusculum sp. TaxID=2713644 RepID=UPI002724E4AF|nr:type VI secretion system tip protein VgrG [Methylicorpusculum sp.]MDO8843641.1 type VI secretion system tip protein VgrG [Methylicorpusculum sp.]MDO8939960.1 type VI secretion system tip protein VgrG [Methylicorpusculum sp.]MDP2203011.1 type VI secretion system tip protein VgrG [Methylicorpusculum sp.]
MAQNNRTVTATTPLGKDQLIFYGMTGTEKIGRLFEFEVELIREIKLGSVKADQLLGKGLTVKLELKSGDRFFNGEIVQFKHTGFRGDYIYYRATVKPWLWYLSLNANSRIFQDKSVVDVIKAVLAEYAFADVKYKIEGSYESLDYCVQYRESDFDFISRLMEHDGIFYYFEHQNNKHTLVITDSNNDWQSISGYQTIPFFPPGNIGVRERDHIHEWLSQSQVTAGKYELNDFDFETPSTDLTSKKHNLKGFSNNSQEVYDFPGKYTKASVGTKLTEKRLEETQMAYSLKQGQGNAAGVIPGMKFKLTDYYFAEENTEHVIVSASYTIMGDALASGMGGGGEIFQCQFTAIDASQVYRSQRITPKPVIAGSQTAIVVGKSGEEIWTDKYGRVKVQFHWDRDGQSDEKSSCWVRVSQPMAGKKWGWISLPRIGQEVVVSFLEGDPDQPLITGRVYNGEQMPPYDLPANQTQSGIKTRSSKEGSAENFNELRFEDKKDSEEIYIHAEKDFNCVIENNETRKIGLDKKDKGDQTIEIQNHRTVTLNEGTDTLTVKMGDRKAQIDQGDDSTQVKAGDHSVKVDVGKSTIEAMTSIELKVGGNSIKIEQSGITIKGMMVTIQGDTKLDAKSPMTTVNGDGMLTLKGGIIMIN